MRGRRGTFYFSDTACTALGACVRGRRVPLDRAPPFLPPCCAVRRHLARDAPFPAQTRCMTASRAIPKRVFTPARKNRARISHVLIFQNVGSAHAHPSETPRNPTSGSGCKTGPFPAFFAIGPAAQRPRHPFRTPQNGPKTVSAPCRKRIASTAQQTPVG